MKRLSLLLLATTLLAGTADAASLKGMATVNGPQVRLGDIFEGLPTDQATRPVMTAPEPGRSVTLDPAALARLAAANGVTWQPVAMTDRIRIDRLAVQLGTERIVEALEAALSTAGHGDSFELMLDNRTLALTLPSESGAALKIENLHFDRTRSRLTADLVVADAGIRQTVGAKAVELVEVPVLNRRVAPGEIITAADLDWTTMPRDRAGADLLIDAEAVIGTTPKRNVAPNRPLREADLRAPIVVARGSVVSIVLQTPQMTLTAQGRALADGAVGEVIRVSNTTSNRVIEAKVAADGVVRVLPAGLPMLGMPKPTTTIKTASN